MLLCVLPIRPRLTSHDDLGPKHVRARRLFGLSDLEQGAEERWVEVREVNLVSALVHAPPL